ncbi:type VII secretion integral membrane protein EccD [Streptomyces sp. H27-D2]|uniref:type VII secretion integral membrane protein EccD n=1 Tax=Streptomyces sp. H27-D2 TaxID=3046304 RepID=UPI002DBCD10B|nr:type VII secretion integral membrane protein EccD [Streptomyces sp. H27-D2]MEC4020224.1 type VII secretion integral membrane protein EccD [Streptomyces sp. H27-D2]
MQAPETSFELAVPSDIALADLLPTIVDHAGTDLHERGAEAGGWVLQRLGEAPLDEESTLNALGLRDGETLHLRARNESLPKIHFDDLVEGLSSGLRERSDSWRPAWSRYLMTALTLCVLGAGLLLLVLPGPGLLRAVCAAGAAVLLLAAAGSSSRALGDAGAAGALGAAAIPYFALAGALVPQGSADNTELGARLLAGCAAGAGCAVLALAAVGACAPLFLGAAVAAALGAVGGAVMLFGVPVHEAAAPMVLVVVILGNFLPSLAFRLSGLRLPLLPTNADQLQEGIEPVPDEHVVARGAIADGYLTALYGATGLVAAGCLTALARETSWPPLTVAAVLSTLLLTHARALGGAWQRLGVVLPGAYGAVLLIVLLTLRLEPAERPLLLAALIALAAMLAIAGWTFPGRRLVPYWGRAVDLLQLLLAIALVPLALLAAGLYHYLRALNG